MFSLFLQKQAELQKTRAIASQYNAPDRFVILNTQRSRLIFMMRAYSLTDEERFFLLSKVQDLEYDIDLAKVFATDHGKKIKE